MQKSVDVPGKVFVGGLNPLTTRETLIKYFSQFGEVTDCVILFDKFTGKSRGFGFVTMKDPQAVKSVIAIPEHTIDSKKVDCKTAVSKTNEFTSVSAPQADYTSRKIFVGGLHYDLTQDELKDYFERYGEVIDTIIMKDKETGKSRGFGFVTFSSEEAVEKVLKEPKKHVLMGKWVDCKRATVRSTIPPKPAANYGYPYYSQATFPMPGKTFEQIQGADKTGYQYPTMNFSYPMQYTPQPYMYQYYQPYQYGTMAGGYMGQETQYDPTQPVEYQGINNKQK